MNRIDFDKIMRTRRRRQGRRDDDRDDALAATVLCGRPPGLYGARLYADQLRTFARRAEKAGAEWIAYIYVARPGQVFFVSTQNICDGKGCPADHRGLGLVYLMDLILPATTPPHRPEFSVWKSDGFVLPGFAYDG